MQPEKKREYYASFQFVAGPEIPRESKQHVEIDACEDFALTALSIRAADTARLEDFRLLLYNSALELENHEGKVEAQCPLIHLPTTPQPAPQPVPGEGIPLAHFGAGETVQVRILFEPPRPTGNRVSAPIEITIGLLGLDKPKKKKKPKKQTARKKKTTH